MIGRCNRKYSTLLVGLLLAANVARAQGPTAILSGTVRDQTGAVLPGADIQVTHQETGRVRTAVTDSGGRYRVPALESGAYTVQASLAGFRTAVKPGVVLTVGSEVVVDLTTEVGQVSESVTVAAEVPLVQTTSAELSGLVGDKEIRDLPLNGRSYEALAFLQPGVVQFTNNSAGTLAKVFTGAAAKMSVGGTPGDFVAFLLDGTDVHDHAGFTPGSVAGNNLGVDSILEFRVLTRNYSAEHGRTAGGVISAVTRSGSNSLHGSAFEFLRNNALDAREFFDRGGTKPFRRNQFGAAAGGPILRDRTFFFVNYEGLRQRLAQTFVGTVPSVEAHQGIVRGANVGVAPAMRPYLELYPLPNGRDFGDGTAEFRWVAANPTREDFGNVRIDHQFSDRNYLFGRLTLDDTEALTTEKPPPFQGVLGSRNLFLTLEEKTILSPRLLNVFRVAFNRTNLFLVDLAQPPSIEGLAFVPGRLWSFTVTGLIGFGYLNSAPSRFPHNIFQYSDDLDFHRGAHSMRMGFNFERTQNNAAQTSSQGQYGFGDLTSFLQARPLQFIGQTLDSKTTQGFRQSLVGFYFQDDIKATDHLNLNLGLRYEFVTIPSAVRNEQYNITNVLTDSSITRGPAWLENPSRRNFGPRFGFAWTPFGERKPVVRGGFGIYHNEMMGRVYALFARAGVITNAVINNPPFPRPGLETVALGAVNTAQLWTWDPTPKTPTVYQYNLTVEQQLPSNVVVTVGYGGSHGLHWIRETTPNTRVPQFLPDGTPFYAGGPRINPALGDIRRLLTDAVANYNSLQLQVTRRLSRGLQAQTSYTYSSGLSEATSYQSAHTDNTPELSLVHFNRHADRGLSPHHQRHVLAVNYTYNFPGDTLRGVAAVLGKGWQMSGILSAASGNPFTVVMGNTRTGDGNSAQLVLPRDRPNLRPGHSNNPVLEKVERWYDPTAFELPSAGFYGNLGRNTVLGPGRVTFNFSLVKTFHLTEGHTLAFRSEFFNLLNRANFGLPNRTNFTSSGAYAGNAGVIQSLSTTSRQIQFGLRYSF